MEKLRRLWKPLGIRLSFFFGEGGGGEGALLRFVAEASEYRDAASRPSIYTRSTILTEHLFLKRTEAHLSVRGLQSFESAATYGGSASRSHQIVPVCRQFLRRRL